MQRSEHIVLKRGIHRSKDIIWLLFSNRWDWLRQLKTLKELAYSNTNKTWYIPYDKLAYHHFKQLDIPFVLSGTHADGLLASKEEPAPSRDHTSISLNHKGHSESPSTGLEVSDIHEKIKISWTGKGFVIDIPYDVLSIEKVKRLEGAFWNNKVKKWYTKGTPKNLELLHEGFNVWDDHTYKKWYDVVMLNNFPCKVQLYRSPKYKDQVCIKVIGYGANHQIVKKISNRQYLKSEQIYLIPSIKEQIDDVLESYEDIGYQIDNRLDTYIEKSAIASPSRVKRIESVLQKYPSNKYSFLKRFSDVMLAQNYSINTIRDYMNKLSGMLEWCGAVDMKDIGVEQVNQYMQHLIHQERGFSVINMLQSAVKIYAKKVSEADWSDLSKLERPRKPRTLPKFLSEGEVVRLLDAIDNPKHLAIVCTLYGSGIRHAEILNIKISDIYWDRNQILIKSGKGNKDRMVTLSESSKAILDIYFHEYKPAVYLLEGTTPGKQYSASSISSMLKRAAKKANISKTVTPHMLRHSYATHQMDVGIAIPKIQKLLGHKDIKTTLIYTHLTNQDMQKVASPLDRVMGKLRKPD